MNTRPPETYSVHVEVEDYRGRPIAYCSTCIKTAFGYQIHCTYISPVQGAGRRVEALGLTEQQAIANLRDKLRGLRDVDFYGVGNGKTGNEPGGGSDKLPGL